MEENRRLKRRTEDRLEIAQAKVNYWKQYRGKEEGDIKEEERGAWEAIKEGITALEEDGIWIKEEKRIEKKEEDVEGKEGVLLGSEKKMISFSLNRKSVSQSISLVVSKTGCQEEPRRKRLLEE